MNVDDAMAALAAAGSEQKRAIHRRHGAGEHQFGVSFGDLRTLAKSIRHDHDLAVGLWATGNADARMLACMVADPARMSEADLDAWLGAIEYSVLVDEFVKDVASQRPGVRERAERWRRSHRDWTAQAGWDLVGYLAAADSGLPEAYFVDRLADIEGGTAMAGNRTRHAMNGAIVNIGLRSHALREAAVDVASRIGPVVVDHGATGCVTPAAIPYIERTLAYRAAQAAKRARSGERRTAAGDETAGSGP